MNLNQAIDAHVKWKVRLRMFISGSNEKLDPATVCKDDQCDLGKWIQSQGASQGSSAAFQLLRKEHAEFHRCAAEVVRTAIAGKKSEALALLSDKGSFSAASERTVQAILGVAPKS